MVRMIEEALTPDILDEDKYERSKRIAWVDMEKIQRTKVLVIGAGATGNEVLKNLVLSGYKNITIVDMDYVVRSNLNRCLFFSEEDAVNRKFKAEAAAQRIQEIDGDIYGIFLWGPEATGLGCGMILYGEGERSQFWIYDSKGIPHSCTDEELNALLMEWDYPAVEKQGVRHEKAI